MVGQRLIQIVAHVPAHAQSIRNLAQEQALGADVFKEHHQLQLKKHDWINGGSSNDRVGLTHQIIYKREIQNFLQMAVKMVLGNQFLQRYVDQCGKRPLFETHHDGCSSSSPLHRHFPPLSTSALLFSRSQTLFPLLRVSPLCGTVALSNS